MDSGTGSAGIGPGNAWQKIVNDVVSVNPQVGTSYTVLSSDRGKLVTLTNAAAIAVTVPQAGVAFPAGWWADFEVLGAGAATFTPTTSTVNNGASVSLATKQSFRLVSDGTNYFALLGMTSVAVTNAVAHQFATSNNANGSLNLAQPAFSDISSVLAQTQLPASIGAGSSLTSIDAGTF